MAKKIKRTSIKTVKITAPKKPPAKKITTETRKFSKKQRGTGDGGPKNKQENNR